MKTFLKSSARRLLASISYRSGNLFKKKKDEILILAYHRIIPQKEMVDGYIQPGMHVSPDAFEMQIRYLIENFKVISFSDAMDLWFGTTSDSRGPYCVVTFDDGWRDNYLYAYPVLLKYQVPATIFLTTDFIGTNRWFWPDKLGYMLKHYHMQVRNSETRRTCEGVTAIYPWLRDLDRRKPNERIDFLIEGCKIWAPEEIDELIRTLSQRLNLSLPEERGLLNWDEVKEMSQHGISFGAHSQSHRILTKLAEYDVRQEIQGSLQQLKERAIKCVPVFCYPNGEYTAAIAGLVRAAGFQAAVTTRFGFEIMGKGDLFALKRISIHHDVTCTIPLFSFQISGLTRRR
jgi:peptidoglycan/xylan/chitin deacetylase (PgdA/CDA1 family)